MTATGCSLVIAGAQKSASTSIAELLGRHPQVAMVEREVMALEDPYYPRRMPDLERHIEESRSAGLVPAFKRPELFHRPETPRRLTELLPDPYVVVVLREPVSRTVSAYYHYVRHGLLPAVDVNVGIPVLLDALEDRSPPGPGQQVVRYSLYAESLGRMQDSLGDRMATFFQEELLLDAPAVAHQTLNAIGLEPHPLGPLPKVNAGGYRLQRYRPASAGGRLGYEIDDRDGTFRLTERPARLRLAQVLFALDRRLCTTAGAQPPLRPAVRQRLAAMLAPDARRLPQLLGRPLPETWSASLEE